MACAQNFYSKDQQLKLLKSLGSFLMVLKFANCRLATIPYVELHFGTKKENRFMELRADMFSCRNNTAVRIDVNITDLYSTHSQE